MWSSKRTIIAACAVVVVAGAGAAAFAGAFTPSLTPAQLAAQRAAAQARAEAAARHRALLAQAREVASAEALVGVNLPKNVGAAAPAPTTLFAHPLTAHVVYGFVPYWEVSSLSPTDYADVSAVAYYGVNVGATGGLDQSGPGWADLQQPSFSTFVGDAHAAGDRVLFTASTVDASVIKHLTQFPTSTAPRLAAQVAAIVAADHLDGVDLDIEGRDVAERAGFVAFASDFVSAFRRLDPAGEIVLDTYPQSAISSSDFFDVRALTPLVDTIFVMAYDMVTNANASPNSPLASPTLGLSDIAALDAYKKVSDPAKVVLGLPFYGYDFTTASRAPGSVTVTEDPVAVTYASIAATGRPELWDPATESAYYVFRRAGAWHQTWFDDPVSLALKSALAVSEGYEGVGAWALGQEGAGTQMLAALDGGTPAKKLGLATSW